MKIDELTLITCRLEEQHHFYARVLGLPVISKTDTAASYRIGRSVLSFEKGHCSTPTHFAFNIPSNKETEALGWLKERLSPLPHEGNEIANFSSWNARAIYFYDADRNIVEFIARKNLKQNQQTPFNSHHLLSISEIGLPVSNIADAYRTLNAHKPLPVFDGSFDVFCAAGDEEGLFILVDIAKKTWLPTREQVVAAEFRMRGDYNLQVKDSRLELLQQPAA